MEGRTAMNFRYCTLDSSGQIADFEDWSCASEAEALERAARHNHAFGAELWKGDRKVSSFPGGLGKSRRDDASGARA
jgi:hypothetical protein